MSNFLIDHARINAWCNPTQDNHLIFAGKRISTKIGQLNSIHYFNRKINLPSAGKRYHVFHIGQVSPSLLGLFNTSPIWSYETWIKFQDTINLNHIFINIYNDFGVNIPKYNSYYMLTSEKGLIYAIEDNRLNTNIDYYEDTIYIRLYTNAFFQSVRANSQDDLIYCEGKTITSNDDILSLQTQYNIYAAKQGHVFVYKNGLLIDRVDMINLSLQDEVEFIFDGSVKRIEIHVVKDLYTFNSLLDNKYKYIIPHLGQETDTIDYQDDIDINIIYNTSVDRYKGIYYHRNLIDSHRMITHKDYSITIGNFSSLASNLSELIPYTAIDIQEMKIQVIIRESGYHRNLIYDNNRIFELFKLPNNLRLEAMSGLNSSYELWKAENLENSYYSELLSSDISDINTELVKNAYGYNSISKYIADNPIYPNNSTGLREFTLPVALRNNATIYEYDINGYLLGSYTVSDNDIYIAENSSTRIIEGIRGIGSYIPHVVFGSNNIPLSETIDYKVYVCRKVNGVEDNIWEDITNSEYYTIVNNTLIRSNLFSNQLIMVRFADSFLDYDLSLLPSFGLLNFSLSEIENRGLGIENYLLPVPLGQLDIFLNGKSLIKDIDYIINFPKVYIINKEYLNQPANSTPQIVRIRYYDFFNESTITDIGFIEHGMLSNNNKFNIRDDKVLHISIDGKLVDRNDNLFSELLEGNNVIHPLNGKPYQIKDIIVPMKDYINTDTFSFRNESIIIDNSVSDYMTLKLPQPTRDNLNAITDKYKIVSPFICYIIYSLINNNIDSSLLTLNMSDNDVMSICANREYLLDYDPITDDHKLNSKYVLVVPHNLDNTLILTQLQYSFLTKVIRLYGNEVITLNSISPFINIVN